MSLAKNSLKIIEQLQLKNSTRYRDYYNNDVNSET